MRVEQARELDWNRFLGGDPARKRVDEAVQFGVGQCPVNVPVSFRSYAVEVVRTENDFERAAAADQMREAATCVGEPPASTTTWTS